MRKTDAMDPIHEDRRRDPLFDALRADMATRETPPAVEQALLQAFARQFPQPMSVPQRRRRWVLALSPRGWALGGGLAGVALALVAAIAVTLPHVLPAPAGVPAAGDPAAGDPAAGGPAADSSLLLARADDGAPFIALDSAERIEDEPAPRVVETEVPRSTLAALGLPLTPDNAGDAVRAELLVASDGETLALRLRDE